MQLKYFTIEFNSPEKVYVSGSRLKGVVKIGFEKPTKMKCINIHIKGKGKSHWEKDDGSDTIDYRAYEYYIQETIKLYGENADTVKHPEGDFTYPFSIDLGKDIPSSYEGKRGYVRYTCTASIERPWKFDQNVKEPFTVIQHYDCNNIPNALTPIVDSVDQKVEGFFCCKCSEEGSMTVKININKTAFVPGEPLVYDISIDNRSQNLIKDMDFILRQNVTYVGYSDRLFSSGKPHFHTKKASFKLSEDKIDVPVNQYKTYKGASTIPALPPSELHGCNIIDIQYNVILVVHNSFTPVKIKKEVYIGTIPATEERQMSPSAPPGMAVSSADIGFSLQPTIPQGLPPSYAECVFGKVDMKDDDDGKHTTYNSWAPSYTYYDWSQQTNYGGPTPSTITPADSRYNDI